MSKALSIFALLPFLALPSFAGDGTSLLRGELARKIIEIANFDLGFLADGGKGFGMKNLRCRFNEAGRTGFYDESEVQYGFLLNISCKAGSVTLSNALPMIQGLAEAEAHVDAAMGGKRAYHVDLECKIDPTQHEPKDRYLCWMTDHVGE